MEYVIKTQFEGPGFVAVPNDVAQGVDLSPEALGVLVYLASMPHGFTARPSVIQSRFRLGRDKWQRIARELREAGAMSVHELRGAGGRVCGRQIHVCWPKVRENTENRETRLSDQKPGSPKTGKPAKTYRQTRKNLQANPAPYKEEKQKTVAGAKAEGSAKAPKAPALPCDRQAEASGAVDVSILNDFQRSCLRQGKPVLIGGAMLEPGQQAYEAAQAAENERTRAERAAAYEARQAAKTEQGEERGAA